MLDNRLTDTTRSGQAADFHRFPLIELDKNGQNRTNRFHVVDCSRLQHAHRCLVPPPHPDRAASHARQRVTAAAVAPSAAAGALHGQVPPHSAVAPPPADHGNGHRRHAPSSTQQPRPIRLSAEVAGTFRTSVGHWQKIHSRQLWPTGVHSIGRQQRRRRTVICPSPCLTDMRKTLSFACLHFSVAFVVGWAISGDWRVGGALALVEPLCNTVAFHFHEKLWQRRQTPRAADAGDAALARHHCHT